MRNVYKEILEYMSNLRQKHSQARSNQFTDQQTELLASIDSKLDILIELLSGLPEQINTNQVVITKEVSESSLSTKTSSKPNRPSDFIPSIDTSGMTASNKGVKSSTKTRNVRSNVDKLKDLQSGESNDA